MATASVVPRDQTIVEFDVRTDEILGNTGANGRIISGRVKIAWTVGETILKPAGPRP